MGKVLNAFTHGYPGAISRAVDDIVISLPNGENAEIPFGTPVFLNTAGSKGLKPTETSTADRFAGIAVRSASKTPDTYLPDAGGRNAGTYQKGELMDVLTRGTVTVKAENAGAGKPVYMVKATGALTSSSGSGDANLLLPNCHFRSGLDTSGCAELLLNTRNIL